MGIFSHNSSRRVAVTSGDRTGVRPAAKLAAGNTKPTVLLVDDDCAVRNGISRVLTTEALEVTTARGVKDALDHIYRAVPDLVVTDLCMSPLTGWDLIAFLGPRFPDLPIFVITAQRLPFAGGVEVYSAAFFQKPLDFEALLKAIRQRLGLTISGGEYPPLSA
jgi:DNA-binding NtrC family response regulator